MFQSQDQAQSTVSSLYRASATSHIAGDNRNEMTKKRVFLHRSASASTANTEEVLSDSEREFCRNDNENEHRIIRCVRVSSLIRGSAKFHHAGSQVILVEQQQQQQQPGQGDGKGNEKTEHVDEKDSDDEAQTTQYTLTFTEKDSYGQSHPIETPELIAAKVAAFDMEVSNIPKKRRKALSQAMERCPDLLHELFKLKFLRCELFQEKRAAKRYAKYWDRRLDVFGQEKAFQPLTQNAALKDDLVALSMGFLTLVRRKDASGRNIIFGDPSRQDFTKYTTKSMIRAIWYLLHVALEEEGTQKRGLVFLSDLSSASVTMLDHELLRVVALSVTGCIPVRLSGIHGCHPPMVFWVLFPVIKMLLGEKLRRRVKFHSGSTHHAHTELAKYGLGGDAIPSELGGNAVINNSTWLEEMRLLQL